MQVTLRGSTKPEHLVIAKGTTSVHKVQSAQLVCTAPALATGDIYRVLESLTRGQGRVTAHEGWEEVLRFIDMHLGSHDRDQFWSDFRAAIGHLISVGDEYALADLLSGWEATAEIEADPEEARALNESIRQFDAGEFEKWEDVKKELLGE